MHRRTFLTTLPFAAGMAGCVSDQRPGRTSSPADGRSSTGTASATDPTAPSVRLRASYRYGINDDAIGVLTPENDQFAFVGRPTTDDTAPPAAFTLALGDHSLTPISSVPGFMSWTPGIDSVYTEDDRTGALLFDVPTVETDTATLIRDGDEYALADDDRERLATAPELRLESVSAPESVGPKADVEFEVTVTNEGDRAGTFLAGFGTGGYPKTVDVSVAPGETASRSVRYDVYDDAEAMHFSFTYPGGDGDYEVAVENESATETGTATPAE